MDVKKKISLPILILIVAVALGLLIASVGLIKQGLAKKTNEDRQAEALTLSQNKIDVSEKRIKEIDNELPTLNKNYETKNDACNSLDQNSANWFKDKSKCQRESTELYSKIKQLEMEKIQLKNDNYTVYYSLVKPMSYQIFYIIGACVAGLGAVAAFVIYLVKGKKTY